jgi:indolepyruvate ferredoxin oxidoreductase
LGTTTATNLFLLGYAYQKGLLPVSVAAIRNAIELNAAEIESNLRAFDWGRRAALDFNTVRAQAGIPAQAWQPLQDVDAIIADRYRRLVDYQDDDYAQQYREFVERVKRREQTVTGDSAFSLTKTIARNLYKLMAYKDEYEVARLYASEIFSKQLRENFSGKFTLQFHMAPPLLSLFSKRSVRPRKYALPGWILPVFSGLAKLKFLRATPFDIFGYTSERKVERELIEHYVQTAEHMLENIGAENLPIAVEIAALPQMIRGFGEVKMRNIEAAAAKEIDLLQRFDRSSPATGEAIFYRAA